MADKKQKKPTYNTPAGEAVWPWINKPDDRPIKGKPQKPAYKLNVRYLATNPAWLKLKETLDTLVEESFDKAVDENPKKKKAIVRQYPYAMETDDDGEETGNVILKLKQNAFFTDKKTGETKQVFIDKFTAAGTPMKAHVLVYGGSVVIASFSTRPYLVDSTNGAGISLDLRAVQVIQLVSNQERSASSYGFAAEEGYDGEGEDDVVEDEAETGTADAPNSPDF